MKDIKRDAKEREDQQHGSMGSHMHYIMDKEEEQLMRKAFDAMVITSTSDSQGRDEVQRALTFQQRMARGTMFNSQEKGTQEEGEDIDSLGGTTLVLGQSPKDSVFAFWVSMIEWVFFLFSCCLIYKKVVVLCLKFTLTCRPRLPRRKGEELWIPRD